MPRDLSSVKHVIVTNNTCYRCYAPAASMNGVKKWLSWKFGQVVRVLDLENEGTMDHLPKAVMTKRQRSEYRSMEEDMSVSIHERPILCKC